MKIKFYSVYDKKADCYSKPFDGFNNDCAKRMVAASMDESSMLRKYPTDYRLDFVFSFDYSDGSVDCVKEIVSEVSNLVPLACIGDGPRVGEGKTV